MKELLKNRTPTHKVTATWDVTAETKEHARVIFENTFKGLSIKEIQEI